MSFQNGPYILPCITSIATDLFEFSPPVARPRVLQVPYFVVIPNRPTPFSFAIHFVPKQLEKERDTGCKSFLPFLIYRPRLATRLSL